MKNFVDQIAPILPALIRILEILGLIICRKEIGQFVRDMLTDDGKILSSRRGIAFGAAWTLFILCIKYYQEANTTVLWILVTLIVLCLGLATLPQIIDLWGKIKNAIPGSAPVKDPAPAAPAQININTEISQTQPGT